jgi:DNA-binding FadR family transcriptional regulator
MTNRPIFQKKDLKRTQLLYQIVQEEIKSYIIQNSLLPGDSLPPETELGELLGVSRNSVREAVKSLETLGILQARPGAGLYVSNFSFDPLLEQLGYGILFDHKQLTDIIDVRFHLEHGLLDRAVLATTPDQLAQLQTILDEMRRAAENGLYSAAADRDFHRVLWANVDNTIVGKILDVFWMIFRQAQARSAIPDPPQPLATYQRHVPIVEALAQHDVAAARLAMEQHYTGIQERLSQINVGQLTGQNHPPLAPSAIAKPSIN